MEGFVLMYGAKGRLWNGTLYLPLSIGQQFIEECRRHRMAIVGIDFYHIHGQAIVPVLPVNSLDCSDLLYRCGTWDEVVEKTLTVCMQVIQAECTRDEAQYAEYVMVPEIERRA